MVCQVDTPSMDEKMHGAGMVCMQFTFASHILGSLLIYFRSTAEKKALTHLKGNPNALLPNFQFTRENKGKGMGQLYIKK